MLRSFQSWWWDSCHSSLGLEHERAAPGWALLVAEVGLCSAWLGDPTTAPSGPSLLSSHSHPSSTIHQSNHHPSVHHPSSVTHLSIFPPAHQALRESVGARHSTCSPPQLKSTGWVVLEHQPCPAVSSELMFDCWGSWCQGRSRLSPEPWGQVLCLEGSAPYPGQDSRGAGLSF